MARLDGFVALVTGGGSGLGRAVTAGFIGEGARVGVLEHLPEKVEKLRADFGEEVLAVQGDVRNLDDNRRAVAETVATFGRLDAFIGVAAIHDFTPFFTMVPLEHLEASFDEVMAVNTKGYLLGAIASVPHLRASGGSVILTLSPAGFFAGAGGPSYTVSKHAGVGLVRQLAYELSPTVRVNGIVPGPLVTSDLRGPATLGQETVGLGEMMTKQARAEGIKHSTPLGIYADDAELVPLYLFLAGNDAKLITGAMFHCDQGVSAVGVGMARLEAARTAAASSAT